jgi:sulfotransferase
MKKQGKNTTIIYNSSLPQSGSELLQVLMHQNPAIYGSATSPLLEYWYGARGNTLLPEVKAQPAKLMEAAFMGFCVGGAQGYYGQVTDRPVVLDKSRGWLQYFNWIEAAYGEKPKMICMVRDLRSIISHMEKVFRRNQHRPDSEANPAELANMTVDERCTHWMGSAPVGLALKRLYGAMTEGYGEHIHFVRYEDLTENPQETVQEIYEYLGMDPFIHNFQKVQKKVKEDDTHFGPYGSHKVQPKVTPHKPDYQAVLGRQLCDRIQQNHAWFYEAFYK